MHFIMVMCQFYILFIEDAVKYKIHFLTIVSINLKLFFFFKLYATFYIIYPINERYIVYLYDIDIYNYIFF